MSTIIHGASTSHMKAPRLCIACSAKFQPVTKWQEFCTPEHRYAWSESIKLLGLTYMDTPVGKGQFMEFLKVKLVEVDEKAGRKAAQTIAEIEEKVAEIKATTWGEWIKSNFNTPEAQEAFIKENQGTTFMSVKQFLGETYEDFLGRAGAETNAQP